MRHFRLITFAVVAAAILIGALLWILQLTLRLESEEKEARRIARQEERVRLALWRLDSALSTFLAHENALPVDPSAGSLTADPPFLLQRFEMSATSPSECDDELPSLQQLLDLLQQPALRTATPPTPARRQKPAVKDNRQASVSDPVETPQPVAPEPIEDLSNIPGVTLTLDTELQSQMNQNFVEFTQRQNIASQQLTFQEMEARDSARALAEPEEDPPAPIDTIPIETASAESLSIEPLSIEAVPTETTLIETVPTKDLLPPTDDRVLQTLQPVWLDGRLLLVRRVERQGSEALQGLALDSASSRAWLLDQVQDLVPHSDLVPVLPHQSPDPGRQLALLPWRLVLNAPLVLDATDRSSVRLGLYLALTAIVVVLLGIGLTMLAGLRLARRRSDFASAVIHELRTPLTTFRFYTDMLAEGTVPVAEQPRYLETLRQEADRLGHLVENVLAYARLERTPTPTPQPLALETWLQDVAERLQRRAEDHGFSLDISVQPNASKVHVAADPVALERILLNLCDNSCKYAAGSERLELSADLQGRTLALDWRDYGPGIPRSAWPRLFRPFQRSEDSAQQETLGGIGLGLALSRQLARRWGGDLRPVEPQDGVGIQLRLQLRVVDAMR